MKLKIEYYQTNRFGDTQTGIRCPSGKLKIPNVIGHIAKQVESHGASLIRPILTVIEHEGIRACYQPGSRKVIPFNADKLESGEWFVPLSNDTKWGFLPGTEGAHEITNLTPPAGVS